MNISDIQRMNRRTGHHFFDEETMRFFDSIVYQGVYGGRFFVTSEEGPNKIRRWSVRRARPDGSILTVGDFQGHTSHDDAIEAAEEAAKTARLRKMKEEAEFGW
jgi:hypothetical protein